ncbi:hypothetical protein [Methylorubrum sp. SL192]|uniref:hypothetical protein n=1 Tax=Methylorubrum sp. SL192 TaxID=2995167 RepID=UPI002273119D|nr:hypothetical protein [Methylorubrum sp. SL192]MCY1643169.1 hypothetical protein [Methylorubrum sp. SL192]
MKIKNIIITTQFYALVSLSIKTMIMTCAVATDYDYHAMFTERANRVLLMAETAVIVLDCYCERTQKGEMAEAQDRTAA